MRVKFGKWALARVNLYALYFQQINTSSKIFLNFYASQGQVK